MDRSHLAPQILTRESPRGRTVLRRAAKRHTDKEEGVKGEIASRAERQNWIHLPLASAGLLD
ncbi:MAG: hypothetical protein EON59_04805 [Alphaproteobacteria bacterium]|nr:MAG: hypothetical protein EON59_04805 [Alphaproteobacteria bacterium]